MIDRILSTLWRTLANFYLEKDESMNLSPRAYGSNEIEIMINDVKYIVSVRQA